MLLNKDPQNHFWKPNAKSYNNKPPKKAPKWNQNGSTIEEQPIPKTNLENWWNKSKCRAPWLPARPQKYSFRLYETSLLTKSSFASKNNLCIQKVTKNSSKLPLQNQFRKRNPKKTSKTVPNMDPRNHPPNGANIEQNAPSWTQDTPSWAQDAPVWCNGPSAFRGQFGDDSYTKASINALAHARCYHVSFIDATHLRQSDDVNIFTTVITKSPSKRRGVLVTTVTQEQASSLWRMCVTSICCSSIQRTCTRATMLVCVQLSSPNRPRNAEGPLPHIGTSWA